MEQKCNIYVETTKSNKSENQVWVISTRSYRKKYCRNALTALRYAFILKKKTGRRIEDAGFIRLVSECRARKSETQESAQAGS